MKRFLAALFALIFAAPAFAETQRTTVTPTVTAGAYSANDVVGGLLTFALRPAGEPCSGVIRGVRFHDRSTQEAALVLVLFDAAPTSVADNAAFTVADGDLTKWIDTFASGTYSSVSAASNGVASADPDSSAGGSVGFESTTCTVYGLMYTTGTPTYVSTSDISVTVDSDIDDNTPYR